MRDILSVRAAECHYCVTDDTPFIFCGDPVQPGSSYCPEHHAVCHNGFGRDIRLLEQMIVTADWNVRQTTRGRLRGDSTVREPGHTMLQESPVTVPVDIQIRGGK